MGALQRTSTVKIWPLVTSPWLHAGVIQLVLSLSSIIIVGHHLEQEFGPCKFLQQFSSESCSKFLFWGLIIPQTEFIL